MLDMLLAFSVFLAFAAPALTPRRRRTGHRSRRVVAGRRIGRHGDSTVFATAFDAFVAIFV